MYKERNERSERRVIFLDIDGVLQPGVNESRFKHDMDALKEELARKYHEPAYLELDKYDVAAVYYDWDAEAVSRLKHLIEETKAEIVLSSDWRHSKNLEQMKLLFRIHDLDGYLTELLPGTKEFSDKPEDLPVYLSNHPDLYYYCVIDDRFMDRFFPGRFVYVDYRYRALSDKHCLEAANILKNGPWWDLAEQETEFADRWEYKKPEERIIPEIHDGIKKAIFLDFDGVLNDDLGRKGDGIVVREYAVEYLRRIVNQTGADIILTSSRRLAFSDYLEGRLNRDSLAYDDFEQFSKLLERNYLMIKGMTPIIGSGPDARPAEIRSWLTCRPDVESFVILDDDDFWAWDEPNEHFVRTVNLYGCFDKKGNLIKEPARGINNMHMYHAIEILKDKSMPKLKEAFVLRA